MDTLDINRQVYDGKFGENYDKLHKPDDENSIYSKYIRERLAESGFGELESIFEFGAGTGHLTIHLAAAFPNSQIICNDISEVQLRILREKLKAHNIRTILGSIEEAAQELDSFGMLACSGVLHHVESPYETVEQLSRKCRYVFIACEPAFRFQISWKAMLLNKKAKRQSLISFMKYLLGYYKTLQKIRNLIYRLLSLLGVLKSIKMADGIELSVSEYLQRLKSERHRGVDYQKIADILRYNGFCQIEVFPSVDGYTDEVVYKQIIDNNLIHHWGLIAKKAQ